MPMRYSFPEKRSSIFWWQSSWGGGGGRQPADRQGRRPSGPRSAAAQARCGKSMEGLNPSEEVRPGPGLCRSSHTRFKTDVETECAVCALPLRSLSRTRRVLTCAVGAPSTPTLPSGARGRDPAASAGAPRKPPHPGTHPGLVAAKRGSKPGRPGPAYLEQVADDGAARGTQVVLEDGGGQRGQRVGATAVELQGPRTPRSALGPCADMTRGEWPGTHITRAGSGWGAGMVYSGGELSPGAPLLPFLPLRPGLTGSSGSAWGSTGPRERPQGRPREGSLARQVCSTPPVPEVCAGARLNPSGA